MTDPKPQYVIRLERRRLLWFLLILAVGASAWFGFVLYGESQDYGTDPGQWAALPTLFWGLLAAVCNILLLVYGLALLVIRERPGQLYRLEDEYASVPEGAPATPSFLQPQEQTDLQNQPEPSPTQ